MLSLSHLGGNSLDVASMLLALDESEADSYERTNMVADSAGAIRY